MVSVHPFAAPQAPWAQRRGLPPRQPWVGICPDASLQTCCGQSRPRLPALPCQWEEEEEAVAGWERLWKEREQDTSQAVGQEGSAVLATSCLSDSSFMLGKLRRSGRGGLVEKQWQSLEERSSTGTRLGHPVLTRSKTCDPSFCTDTEQAAVATGRQGNPSPSLSKRTASYRKAFGELTEREELLACFSCAWQREVPYHGRLYITSHHVCFYSSLLLKDIKAVVPVTSISALKKTNTALLVPNALSIRTAEGQKFLFVSLRRREATYQLLKSVCKHLQDNSWSPLASLSNEEILRKPLTSSQSDLEQSTPEPDNLQEPLDGLSPTPRQAEEEEDEEVAALALSSSERVPLAKPRSFWGGAHTTLWAQITTQLSLLNTILLIYLLLMMTLLLSSMYIGLRITELEQQLASVEARPALNLSQQYKT
ncbi:GRAM domain-containing protein 2A-like [Accipiter gentilis]|uniref:GRAM domain-containing protein 2A-like n=1 Tax=Astur gentilis TaxID=8957 RepID=UPI0021103581|nr:GRAM domain-containing protein 2A-like [Accipiter gentilis]